MGRGKSREETLSSAAAAAQRAQRALPGGEGGVGMGPPGPGAPRGQCVTGPSCLFYILFQQRDSVSLRPGKAWPGELAVRRAGRTSGCKGCSEHTKLTLSVVACLPVGSSRTGLTQALGDRKGFGGKTRLGSEGGHRQRPGAENPKACLQASGLSDVARLLSKAGPVESQTGCRSGG